MKNDDMNETIPGLIIGRAQPKPRFVGNCDIREQRRYEIARDVMVAMLAKDANRCTDAELAKYAIHAADALLKELEKS